MLYKTVKPNKQDRVAKLEWAANGGLGRILMGKVDFFNELFHEPTWPLRFRVASPSAISLEKNL